MIWRVQTSGQYLRATEPGLCLKKLLLIQPGHSSSNCSHFFLSWLSFLSCLDSLSPCCLSPSTPKSIAFGLLLPHLSSCCTYERLSHGLPAVPHIIGTHSFLELSLCDPPSPSSPPHSPRTSLPPLLTLSLYHHIKYGPSLKCSPSVLSTANRILLHSVNYDPHYRFL